MLKESRTAAEAWHRERSGEAAGEGTASIAVKGSGLKGACRKIEPSRHEKSPGEGIGENAA